MRDRPLIWGLLYLFLIPTFAGIYDTAASGFYQTSATHEPGFADLQYTAEVSVARAVQRAEEYWARYGLKVPAQYDRPDELDLSASSTDLVFTLGFFAKDGDLPVQIDIPTNSVRNATFGGPEQDQLGVGYTMRSRTDNTQSAALLMFTNYTNSGSTPNLFLTPSEFRPLEQVATAERGSLQGLSGQRSRMLYFSTVTVTTLGFGDIAPTTTTTRLEVMAEAILGVVFIGLFLNSLASRRRRQTSSLLYWLEHDAKRRHSLRKRRRQIVPSTVRPSALEPDDRVTS